MNHLAKTLLSAAVLIVGAAVQAQTGAQTGMQTNGQASVQAGETHAQASSTVSASSSSSAEGNSINAGLASGTAFNAMLKTPVDSKKSKPGDSVTARTTEDVKASGRTVLPRGTRIIGHVTQASARAKGDSETTLTMTFDRAILKNGQEVPLDVAIQAMAWAQTAASSSENDADSIGGVGANSGAAAAAGGRGAVGGLTSTAGSAVGSVRNTAATVGGTADAAVRSTVSSTTEVAGASTGIVGGVNAAGQLAPNSHGVFGLNGLTLSSAADSNTRGSVITSAGKNVHLDSGTRMLIITKASTATSNP
jgi:hypothetical protein